MLRDSRLLEQTLGAAEQAVLEALVRGVRDRFGTRLERIALVGSRARGDAWLDSDIDVLVVVDFSAGEEETDVDAIWQMITAAKRVNASYVPLAPVIFSKVKFDELTRQRRRFAIDAAREGIPL